MTQLHEHRKPFAPFEEWPRDRHQHHLPDAPMRRGSHAMRPRILHRGIDIAIHVIQRFQLGIERLARERVVQCHQHFAILAANDLDHDGPLVLRQATTS
jgi:hypothetical protein